MKKKISDFIAFMGKKNLIAVSALVVLVVAIGVGIAIANNKDDKKVDKDNETEESTGLQVEENADDAQGDSIDFNDFLAGEEEDDNSGNGSQGNSGSGNSGQGQGGSGNGGQGDGGSGDGGSGNGGQGGTSTGTDTSSDWGPLF